jgi:NADPH:quinone reductase-like Zn-dependent oxidoreductase
VRLEKVLPLNSKRVSPVCTGGQRPAPPEDCGGARAYPDRRARAKSWLYDRLAAGKLKPIIACTFSLEEIVEAHRFMESNDQIAKLWSPSQRHERWG